MCRVFICSLRRELKPCLSSRMITIPISVVRAAMCYKKINKYKYKNRFAVIRIRILGYRYMQRFLIKFKLKLFLRAIRRLIDFDFTSYFPSATIFEFSTPHIKYAFRKKIKKEKKKNH